MMLYHGALRHKTFDDEPIARSVSDTVCLFESPFSMMRLTIGWSVEGHNARMDGGPDIERKQVEW
jgi:hypothetical protein